jgi:hypothetical protein
MIVTYVNNKSSSFHSTGIGYTIRLGYESAKYLLYQGLYIINLDLPFNKQSIKSEQDNKNKTF